jgi:hypothetical protein
MFHCAVIILADWFTDVWNTWKSLVASQNFELKTNGEVTSLFHIRLAILLCFSRQTADTCYLQHSTALPAQRTSSGKGAQNVETYNKNFCETIKVCKCYYMHLRGGRRFNGGFSVCYMEFHSVSLKQVIRVEERKRGISAIHCHLDITPNHPQLPLQLFTKI